MATSGKLASPFVTNRVTRLPAITRATLGCLIATRLLLLDLFQGIVQLFYAGLAVSWKRFEALPNRIFHVHGSGRYQNFVFFANFKRDLI